MPLNQSQQIAVTHKDGPMLVLAGPGSGKTTVIANRVRHLINEYEVPPQKVLVITFTRAAANDMKQRTLELCEAGGVTFGTFHSVFFGILRQSGMYSLGDVLQGDETRRLIGQISSSLGVNVDESEDLAGDIINEISCICNECLDIDSYNSMKLASDEFRAIYKAYQQWKVENRRIDFDDMLLLCHRIFTENPQQLEYWRERFTYILVDEFQDINRIQYECLKMLAAPRNNLFAVGDDDQSIYRFRGANPDFLLSFPKEYPGCGMVALETNYRSTDEIIILSQKIIRNNKRRFAKPGGGTARKGARPVILKSKDPYGEANFIAGKIGESQGQTPFTDIAIIYRNNMQARAFIDSLYAAGIPFNVKDVVPNIFEHWVCRDICAYIRLAINPGDNAALERIINKPSRYVSLERISAAKRYIQGRNITLLEALRGGDILGKRQQQNIEELIFYLGAINKRNSHEAIKYIRKGAGYDSYIRSFADYKHFSPQPFYEFADEIAEASKAQARLEDFLEYVDTAAENLRTTAQRSKQAEPEGVTMTTMHSAKGLEYDTVFVAGLVEGIIPYEKCKSVEEIEEERRLFYVAATRAKNRLYLSTYNTRHDKDVEPSPFLDEIRRNKLAAM